MDRQGVRDFLKIIEARGIRDENRWVNACCPLSPWRKAHKFRQERNPSFGISVHDDARSIYHCFTCHSKGTLSHLLTKLQDYTGEDYSAEIEQFDHGEMFGAPLGKWSSKRGRRTEKFPTPLSEDYEDIYDPIDPEHWYLKDRGISPETCERLQLKIDHEDSQGEPRILFPVFDIDGRLHGYTGRALFDDVEPKVRDYHGLPKKFMLLGVHLVKDADFILLTEGLFDYARGTEYGYATVAVMGSVITPEQLRILKRLHKPIYGFLDNDAAGKIANYEAAYALNKIAPYMSVRWRRRNTGKYPNDLGVLSQWEIERMIKSASIYKV